MTLQEWKQKNRFSKRYAHFDKRISIDRVWNYISNPDKVAVHAFYPFISYEKKEIKYKKGEGKQPAKLRKICYAAHLDNKIYQYYSFMLNKVYTQRAIEDNIDQCVIAYRDNMKSMSNIHFAKKAFDFIKDQAFSYIMIGDFKGYFDSLQHAYLKRKVCNLLKVPSLSDDYYNVFKSITSYGEWKRPNLLKIHGLEETYEDLKTFNEKDIVLSAADFKKYCKDKSNITKNKEGKGIPQGSAISAVFANIYLLTFDKKISELVEEYNGLYMRYSDDFIIVIPTDNQELFKQVYNSIKEEIMKIPELIVEEDKTQLYYYSKGVIRSCNSCIIVDAVNSRDAIDYLGFTFDGQSVDFRAKTIAKYYRRMNKKVLGIVKSKGITKKGNRVSAKNLYNKYSIKGAFPEDPTEWGNFLTYAYRAEKVFDTEDKIKLIRKRHMQKIRNELNKLM